MMARFGPELMVPFVDRLLAFLPVFHDALHSFIDFIVFGLEIGLLFFFLLASVVELAFQFFGV